LTIRIVIGALLAYLAHFRADNCHFCESAREFAGLC
jgi:hypothetical protein